MSLASALASIVIAVWGVVEQKEGVEEQKRVNAEAREEEKLENAVRVTWWTGNGESGPTVNIQNRSLVPIDFVILRYRATFTDPDKSSGELVGLDEGPLFAFSGIAPCTIITMDELAIEEWYLGPDQERAESTGIQSIYWERVEFTDVHGRWAVSSAREPEPIDVVDLTDFDIEGSLLLSDLRGLRDTRDWVVEQSASDCGTG